MDRTYDEWRQILGPTLTDKEIDEFLFNLRRFINTFLDEYFKDELLPDDVI